MWEKEKEGKRSRGILAVSMVGILLGSMMLVGVVRAGTYSFAIPIPNPPPITGITLSAVATNGRFGGGDAVLFDLAVTACSSYSVDSIVAVTVKAYSDANFDANTMTYARAGFHHVIVPAAVAGVPTCVTVNKTVRVHHATAAMADHQAYISATGVIKRDGVALTASDVAWVDVATDLGIVLGP